MTRNYPRFLLAAGLLAAAVSGWAQAPPNATAIVGARIEIGDGRVIEKGTVLIQNGLISAVGENVAVPAGVEVVKGDGLTVYPGFIDGYTFKGLKAAPDAVAGSGPAALSNAPDTMWAKNRKGVRSELQAAKLLDLEDLAKAGRKQGITAGLICPGGGMFRGVGTFQSYTTGAGIKVSGAAIGQGMSFANGTGGGYPGSLMGVIALMRQVLMDAADYKGAADADPALAGLAPLVTGKMPALFTADTDREVVRAMNLSDEFGLKLIFVSGREAYKEAPELKKRGIPVLASLTVGFEPSTTPAGPNPEDGAPAEVLAERHDIWLERAKNTLELSTAGVPFAFSSSGDTDSYLANVRKLIGIGLPRAAALNAMTKAAATILGFDKQLGTIETGKVANLTIMTGDFADAKSAVQTVFVGGEKFEVGGKPTTQEKTR